MLMKFKKMSFQNTTGSIRVNKELLGGEWGDILPTIAWITDGF